MNACGYIGSRKSNTVCAPSAMSILRLGIADSDDDDEDHNDDDDDGFPFILPHRLRSLPASDYKFLTIPTLT